MSKRVGYVKVDVFVIPLTKDYEAVVDVEDCSSVSDYNWTALVLTSSRNFPKVYAYRKTSKAGKQKAIYLHRSLLEVPEGFEVDHVNGNSLDNTRKNLRLVTKQQNKFNRPALFNNTSGYKGVSWDKQRCKWKAAISFNGKTINLGAYDDVKEAALAYQKANQLYHGTFGKT